MPAKPNPLRVVVFRQVIIQRTSWSQSGSLIYHEVLSCGHPLTVIPVTEADMIAQRRRCTACGLAEKAQAA